MKTKTLLVASLLLLGAVAVTPTVSAQSPLCDPLFLDPPQACYLAEGIAFGALDYVLCFLNTAPVNWGNCI